LYIFLCGVFRFQRPPGPIPSSMLGLEVYTGALDNFGFEDYLNGNCFTPVFPFGCALEFSIPTIFEHFSKHDRHILLALCNQIILILA